MILSKSKKKNIFSKETASEEKARNFIVPEKDVDGFHPVNTGRLLPGEKGFVPCTPAGIVEMLKFSGIEIAGKRCVVIGRSNIVGKPVAKLLLDRNATVTVAHSRTADLAAGCREADILVAAVGRPRMITADMVKPGAVVIDVGINRIPDATRPRGYRIVGDVDFEAVKDRCSYITPVPGGVGPMTICSLMMNTLKAAEHIF